MAMHIELQATCSALGYHEGSQYVKEPDCLETVKELIRFLRREDETCDIRRQLGHAQILQKDLLPLVKQHHKDKPLFDTVIRLLVNLTQPVLVCFNNHLPEEKTLRQHCLEIESHLQQYKEAFVDEELFTVLTKKMSELLELDWEHRREEDKLMLERLLVLVRNVLHIPPDPATEQASQVYSNRTDDDASLHDQILWSIHVSGMEDLLLYIASSENERQFCMHILEIVSLMFREQSPEVLAFAGVQRSMTEKEKDERELELARAKEKAQKRNTMLRFNTRHSNFGGTYVMMNTQSLSDKELIYHKPIQEADNFTLDTSKKPRKKPKNRQPIKDVPVIRRSTLSIRLGLKEFCVQLLENAYNRLMYAVKDNLIREATQDLDETYYMWSMKFFMEFCRHHSGHVDFISETLSVQSFHYIYNNLLRYYETITLEKKEAVTWGKRVHLALRAYQELLMTIDMMDKSRNSHLRDSAQVIKSNVFYVMEFRDIFITLLKRFNESRNSRAYLKDLVESTHLFLNMLEKHSKSSNHLVVQGKKRKRKKKTKKVTTKKCEEPSEQELEDLWQELSSELSALLQGRIEVPDDVTPFDATSEVDVDQQRVDAMVRIHQSLRQKKAGEAVALFRAAREVWPEQNEFGSQDITAEEEFMALREIFIAPLPGGSNLEEMQPEEMAEEEIEEEEEVTVAAQASWEQEFNFTAFLMNFAKPEILRSYVLLIADFENNSAHTNHCTVKMLHRIAFDLGFVGMMFQASLFRVFQKLMTGITVAVARFRELYTFGIHVVRKFSEVAEKNKKVFMEMLFWKGSKEAMQITQGYDYVPDTGKVAWTEAEENELIRLFEDFRDVQNPEKDAVDLIMEQWSGTNKTRGQFIRQLKKLQLIESARDLNKKSGPSRAWTADDEQELQQVYQEYKDTDDPLSGIVLALTKKRSKNKVMEKLLALGVVNDRKKLYKRRHRKNDGKKPRRGRHTGSDDDASSHDEGEEGQNVLSEDLDLLDANGDGLPSDEEILSSPSVSGSSSDADDTSDDDSAEILSGENESHQNVDNRSTSSIDLGEMICNIVDKGYKDQVCWIQKLLNQNANVREGQDKLFSVSIVPLTEENETAMEDSLFTNFLQQLGLSPPANEQEVFWRIPSHLKSSDLRAIATGIELNEAGQVLNPEALGQIHFWKPKPSARVKERKRPKPSARVKERKRKPDDKARLAKQERQRKEKRKAEKDKGKERKKRKTDQSSKQHNQDFSPDTIAVEDNVDDSDDQKGSKMSSALQRREALRAMLERRTEKNVSRKKKFPEKVSNEQADCIAETTSAEIEERVISPSPNMDVGQSEVISEKSKKRVKRVMDSNSDSEDRLNKASSHASLPKSTRQVMLSDSAISDNDEDENAAASQSQSQSQGPLDFGDSDDNEDCMPEKVHDASSDDNIPLTGVAQGKEDSFPVTSPYRPPDSEDSDRDCHVPLNALKNRDKFISDDEDD